MTVVEYHRPQTLGQAMALLGRSDPLTLPLAGGTALKRDAYPALAVVDLQELGLEKIEQRGAQLEIGAMASLQALLDGPISAVLKRVIQLEATNNLRQVASAAGTLVAADGRSPFTTALLALDAMLTLLPGPQSMSLGDFLPLREERLRGRLITRVSIPTNAHLAFETVARSPADRPIVCVAVAHWPSGRTRLALGGFSKVPALAFDGADASGIEAAARDAYSQAGDAWATAEYRQEIAGVLARRCLRALEV
jgi:CO/xanthine dehydrogenase FAD-binding subunit